MDATTASFLQDSLRGYTPVLPALPNYYTSLKQGFDVANELDAQRAAAAHLDAAKQSLLAAKQQYDFTDQTNPYNLALLKEKVDLLPLDRKYDQALRGAQIDKLRSDAEYRRTRTQTMSDPSGVTMTPFVSPISGGNSSGADDAANPPLPTDGAPAPASADAAPAPVDASPASTVDDFRQRTMDGFGSDATVTPSATATTQFPLLGENATPIPGTGSLDDSRPLPDAPMFDASAPMAEISGAENPKTARVWRNGVVGTGDTPAANTDDLPVPDTGSDDPMGVLTNYSGRYPRSDAAGVIDTGARLPSGSPLVVGADANQPEPSDDGTGGGPTPPAGDNVDTGGFVVPKNEDERQLQRNAWEAHRQRELSRPMDRQKKQVLLAQLAAADRGLDRVERAYSQNRRFTQTQQRLDTPRARASATPVAGVLTNDRPPEQAGYTLRPTGYVGGKMHWAYVPDDEVQEKKMRLIEDRVKGATAGGDVSSLMHPERIPGGVIVSHMESKGGGLPQEVRHTLSPAVYDNLRKLTDPLYYGTEYDAAKENPVIGGTASASVNGAPLPGANTPALAPPVPGTAPLTPMHMALGPSAMVPGARLREPVRVSDEQMAALMKQAGGIKGQLRDGTISREEAVRRLQSLGFD